MSPVATNYSEPTQNVLTELQVLNKVMEIPVVSKGIDLYQMNIAPVVESNPLTKYAADTATFVVNSVANPVINTVGVENVDNFGLRIFDFGEKVVSQGQLLTEKVLLTPLDKAVKGVDYVVDWVLPVSAENNVSEEFVDASDGTQKPAPFKHALEVTQKASSRVYNVVSSKGQKAYADTEEFFQLRATMEILQQYQSQLESSSLKLRSTLASTQAYLQDTVTDREKLAQSMKDAKEYGIQNIAKPTMESVLRVQHGLIEALSEVRSSVEHSIDVMRKRLPRLPFNVQERLNSAVAGTSKRWEETMKKINEQASLGEGVRISNALTEIKQPVSIEGLLANLKALTQKSIKVIDASTESIEVVAKAKHLLGSYLGINKADE